MALTRILFGTAGRGAGRVVSREVTRNGVKYTVETVKAQKAKQLAIDNFNRKAAEATETRLAREQVGKKEKP